MILDFLFLTITYSAGYLVVGMVTILTALSFALHKHKHRILPLLISVGGSATTIWILKNIFDKPRPEGALYLETSPAFPSGHAALAMALYGFIFLTIWKHEKHHLQNKSLVLLALLIIAVGASRLYLGVHFFSDVLVGYFIGLLWIFVATLISRISPFRDDAHRG